MADVGIGHYGMLQLGPQLPIIVKPNAKKRCSRIILLHLFCIPHLFFVKVSY